MDVENNLENGLPIIVDGVEIVSVGFLEYGNNNGWEVLLPKVRPNDADGNFQESSYDVYFIEHQNYPHELTTRHGFFEQVPYEHFNTAVIQLGRILADYDEKGGVA